MRTMGQKSMWKVTAASMKSTEEETMTELKAACTRECRKILPHRLVGADFSNPSSASSVFSFVELSSLSSKTFLFPTFPSEAATTKSMSRM